MSEVAHAASETARLAESGQMGIEAMEASMQSVLGGTNSISGKLSEIRENASRISTIVTTITKVADQTNLLSLNAAIEAEKAGEYGRGFSVVANEIRRLADQTSVAVLDIEEIVNKMDRSVTEGAQEMEIFTREVQSSVDKISRFGKQMEGIMSRVQTLRPGFEAVNAAMETQSENASQISETMEQLTITTHDTLESLREFNLATDYLKEAARGLQEEVSRFKVSHSKSNKGTEIMMVTLKNKVIGLPVVAAIVPVLVIFVLTYMAKGGVTKNIEGELAALARQNIARIAHAVYNTCAATSKMIEKDLDRQLRDASHFPWKGWGDSS